MLHHYNKSVWVVIFLETGYEHPWKLIVKVVVEHPWKLQVGVFPLGRVVVLLEGVLVDQDNIQVDVLPVFVVV